MPQGNREGSREGITTEAAADSDGGGGGNYPHGRPHPRQICATHGGRLSLLRAAEGTRDVGYGREGRDSGSGGSHSCWVAAATLDVADAGEDDFIRSVFKFFRSFLFLFLFF